METQKLLERIRQLGADNVGLVPVEKIQFDPSFRELCARNACGMYGRNWMCPPYAGDISDLIADAKTYQTALVYQTIDALEDSYDFEGMMKAADRMNRLTLEIRKEIPEEMQPALFLGAGGCHVCSVCAKQEDKPCRFPDKALASLETYGIYVTALAQEAGMRYINGVNTVTYFGAVFMEKEK